MITIASPVYNYIQYVPRLVRSVLAQSSPDWKLLLIDDKSSEREVVDYLESLDHPQITVALHRKNRGTCATVAELVSKTDTEYVTLLDCDNFLMPTYVSMMLREMAENAYDVVHCAFSQYVDMRPTGQVIRKQRITRDNCFSVVPGTMLACFRTEIARKCLPKFELCPDWDMMLRAVEITDRIGYIDEPLVGWEDHKDSRWWWNLSESHTCSDRCREAATQRRARRRE